MSDNINIITIMTVSFNSSSHLKRLFKNLLAKAKYKKNIRFLIVDNTNGKDRDIYLLKGHERKNLTTNIPFLSGYQGNICFYCGEPMTTVHVDHVLARQVLLQTSGSHIPPLPNSYPPPSPIVRWERDRAASRGTHPTSLIPPLGIIPFFKHST